MNQINVGQLLRPIRKLVHFDQFAIIISCQMQTLKEQYKVKSNTQWDSQNHTKIYPQFRYQ